MNIPFFKTTIGTEEKQAISDIIDSGWIVMGKKTQEFEQKFAEYVGAKHAVFVDSGTSALFLALRGRVEINGGSLVGVEVETPSFTFASDPEIIVHNGAIPKFIDVNLDTFCVESGDYKSEIPRVAVHLMGNLANSPAMVYDSAHRIEKDDVTSSEVPWCYSFYATKNLSTIQGGMIATNDDVLDAWLRKARDHGLSHGTLERYTQKTTGYTIDFPGWRMKADDIKAAIGLIQLDKLPDMTAKRNSIVERYNKNLGYKRIGNHLYPVLVSDREKFIRLMDDAGIQCSVHFQPLHLMPAYEKYPRADLTNTEFLGSKIVSIPLFPDITNEEIDYISEQALKTNLLIK